MHTAVIGVISRPGLTVGGEMRVGPLAAASSKPQVALAAGTQGSKGTGAMTAVSRSRAYVRPAYSEP